MYDSIMTEVLRCKRGFTNDVIRKCCGEVPESAIHALRDCKWVKSGNRNLNWSYVFAIATWSSYKRKLIFSTSLSMLKGMLRTILHLVGSHLKKGSWVDRFAKNLGRGSIFQDEIWGAMMGLRMAWGLNLHKIIIETDSSSVVNFFKDDCNNICPFLPLADEIKNFLSKIWIVCATGDDDKDEVAKVTRWMMTA
ncbi:putative ribonuclease H-like domain-containing protein [Senna tora]|uniref:Putative ribonuclease H-like domain-containing protein n=1 Tax=Senna tora TaxID=362788 RepID=A0A834WAQ8_9FABA|nr:putative ribonuclease H-like domain-containing protein [Senna tora]